MLLQLKIENYALIRELCLDFSRGFTCITGETGAGKSILIGALSILLGERADRQILFDKEKKCLVEAVFRISGYGLEDFFENNDIDYEEETILRREVRDNGKSRAFINDVPVPLNIMKDLGEKLVDIHSQNKTITLNDSGFQLAVVDDYINHDSLLKDFKKNFIAYKANIFELENLIEKENKAKAENDYLQFLFEELEKAELKPGEMETVENDLELMNHAELIKTNLYKSLNILSEQENNILLRINEVKSLISHVASYHTPINEFLTRTNQVYIEIKDIAADMTRLAGQVNYDQDLMEALQTKLDNMNRLLVKHHTKTVEGLICLKDEISDKLNEFDTLDEKISNLQKKINSALSELNKKAEVLSNNRLKVIPEIEEKIILIIKQLGIPEANVRIEHRKDGRLSENGFDKVVFLFNANKGGELNELSKVASGGELSRLMLSIKSLISTRNLLPTLILDEIDSGISGETAAKAANIMKEMSKHMQLIAITHLPQIAGKAEMHIRASKEIEGDKSVSVIKVINGEERIIEIAKMLSNENISNSAMQAAMELLSL